MVRQLRSRKVRAARSLLNGLLSPAQSAETWAADAEWLGAAWLNQQGLTALVWHTLRAAPPPCIPAGLAAEWRAAYFAAVGDDELRQHELKSVLEALSAQGVTPVVLKGAALAHTVYPDPACRPMGDLDLWAIADEMPRALAVLDQLGYVRYVKPDRPLVFQARNGGEMQMLGTLPGCGLVELHWGAFPGEWLRRTAHVDEESVRARTVSIKLLGCPVRVLSPEDGIIQLAVHLAINHQMAEPWLRGLVDIVLLARAQPVDWESLVVRARAWRVSVAVWLVLKLAASLAGLDEAAQAIRQLSPSSFRTSCLSHLVDEAALVEMRDLRSGLVRFVYLLLVADFWRDAGRLLGRTLWPERDWLVARYGQCGPATQLRHLASAMRGKV